MIYFAIEAVPGPSQVIDPRAEGAIGACVACWIDFKDVEGAEVLARHYIESAGWLPGNLEKTSFPTRELCKSPEEVAYFEEALDTGACLSFICYGEEED